MSIEKKYNYYISKFLNNNNELLRDVFEVDKSKLQTYNMHLARNMQSLLNNLNTLNNQAMVNLINSASYVDDDYIQQKKVVSETNSEGGNSYTNYENITDLFGSLQSDICVGDSNPPSPTNSCVSDNMYTYEFSDSVKTINNDDNDNISPPDYDSIKANELYENMREKLKKQGLIKDKNKASSNLDKYLPSHVTNKGFWETNKPFGNVRTFNREKNEDIPDETNRCLARIKTMTRTGCVNMEKKDSTTHSYIFDKDGFTYGQQCGNKNSPGQECCKMHQQKYDNGEISLVIEEPKELPEFSYDNDSDNDNNNDDDNDNNDGIVFEDITYERRKIGGSLYQIGSDDKVYSFESRDYLCDLKDMENYINSP